MNENIDLTKILKNCPEGFELYTPLYGKVFFFKINKKDSFSIVVRATTIGTILFTKEGHFFETATDGECLLFPSKEIRDWGKFTVPLYKKERFDPKTLQPFNRILVRNSCIDNWGCSFFSNHRKDELFPFLTCDASAIKYCIPYNDDTKHLIGTINEAPEYYRYWEK